MKVNSVFEKEPDIVYRVQFYNKEGVIFCTHHYDNPDVEKVKAHARHLALNYNDAFGFIVSYNKKGESGWKRI